MSYRSSAVALGLATLMSAAPFAHSEEGSISWAGGSTFAGGTTPFRISLTGRVKGFAYYHDLNEDYNRDVYLRNTTFPLNVTTLAEAEAAANAANDSWRGVNQSFSDGWLSDDVIIQLRGSAYDSIVFGLAYEAASGNAALEDWYLGVTNIPVIGTLTFGKFGYSGINDGKFHRRNTYYDRTMKNPDFTGFLAAGSLGSDGAYRLGIGRAGAMSGSRGTRMDVLAEVRYDVYKQDDTSLRLHAGLWIHNPTAGNKNDPNTQTAGFSFGNRYAPRVVAINGAADQVINVHLNASLVHGPLLVGANVGFHEMSAINHDNATPALIRGIANGDATINYTEAQDGSFTGWFLHAAYSLTGERQGHGGGIRPNENFSWSGPGLGAFEVAARVAGGNFMDDIARTVTLPLPGATNNQLIAALLSDEANRKEGGEFTEISLGFNWYLNRAMNMGISMSHFDWKHDDGVVNNPASNARALAFNANPSMADILNFAAKSQISNDYDVTSFYFRAEVSF